MDSRNKLTQVQIDDKNVEMWFDPELKTWKFSIKKWDLDHWKLVSSAECKSERIIKTFYYAEVRYLKAIQAGRELGEEKTV